MASAIEVFVVLGGEGFREPAPQGLDPGADCLDGLFDERFLLAFEPRHDEPDVVRHERCDPHQGAALAGKALDLIEHAAGHGEGNDLDSGDHLPLGDDGERFQSRDGRRFVGEVERVEPGVVIDQKPRTLGIEIGPAGEGLGNSEPGSGGGLCQARRRLVLGNVAVLEPGREHRPDSGLGQRGDIGVAQHAAFLEGDAPRLDAVRKDRAAGLRGRNAAELHAPSLRFGVIQPANRAEVQRRRVMATPSSRGPCAEPR